MRVIMAAAIQYEGVTYTGVRHSFVFDDLRKLGFPSPYYESLGYIQGFITKDNKFVNREEAKEMVLESGQSYNPHAPVLTSEDLW